MESPVETARITLVTIIAQFALQERLLVDLKLLGATGYTFASVDGRGRHGRRMRSITDAGNEAGCSDPARGTAPSPSLSV